MKSFECESSSEGDEPTILPISRAVADPQPWMKGGNAPTWTWQTVRIPLVSLREIHQKNSRRVPPEAPAARWRFRWRRLTFPPISPRPRRARYQEGGRPWEPSGWEGSIFRDAGRTYRTGRPRMRTIPIPAGPASTTGYKILLKKIVFRIHDFEYFLQYFKTFNLLLLILIHISH